ncbi:MAG: hypothetical protein ACM3PV_09180 [Betaproteobacteria bacterium]
MRAAAPLAGVPVLLVLLQQDPSAVLRGAAVWLLGPPRGSGAGLALALVCLALASWAAPRVTAGLGGWARHLPVSATTHRRSALVALAVAQSPVLAALAFLAPLAAREPGGLAAGRLASLPLIMAGAALAAWPGTRAWRSRPLAGLALAAATLPAVGGLLLALLLLVAAERLAGPLPSHAAPARRRTLPLPLPALVSGRAVGPVLLPLLLVSLLPVGAMTLLRVNNDLAPAVAAGAARFGGGIGVVLLLSGIAERMAVRRPVWPWARSLPLSATRRVGEDAVCLAVPCLVPLAATACLDVVAALAVAACLPTLALLAAGALRADRPAGSGVATGALGAGALLAAWVAVLPWLAGPTLVAAPLALRSAAARERRLKVGLWDERHHRAVGDPLSWSAQ